LVKQLRLDRTFSHEVVPKALSLSFCNDFTFPYKSLLAAKWAPLCLICFHHDIKRVIHSYESKPLKAETLIHRM
jgi:hypothetical protein